MIWIELVVIALVVGFIISRLTGFKLPTDTRDTNTRKAEMERLFGKRRRQGPSRTSQTHEAYETPEGLPERAPEAPVKPRRVAPTAREVAHLPGLEQLKAMDANFDLPNFMEGAIAAYMYFYECYNARDREGIINLCGPALEETVLQDWETNPAALQVEGEPQPTFKDARLHGRTALVEIAFTATHRTGKGAPKPTRSVWLFARALNSTDPNWEVQSITPAADA
ncbi:MAG: TIM44-like domain-containing protein [Pseudomonadota bacterium]